MMGSKCVPFHREGVAAAFLPVKLMEPILASGSVVKLRSVPEFRHAAVCAGHRIGGATAEIEAVIAAAQRVLKQVPFLLPPLGAEARLPVE